MEKEEKSLSDERQEAKKVMRLLDSLPKEQRTEMIKAFCTIQQTSFQGPLPPPDMMKGYESVLPGAAERIMKMAENQSTHRMNMESKSMRMKKAGQIFGFIITLFIIGLSFWLGIKGHDALAGVIGSTTVIALTVIFVLGKVPKGQKKG